MLVIGGGKSPARSPWFLGQHKTKRRSSKDEEEKKGAKGEEAEEDYPPGN